MVPIAEKFFQEAKLPMALVPEIWQANWSQFLDLGLAVIYVSTDRDGRLTGGIGGLAIQDPNDGQPVLSEMFWYVDPASRGDGLRLLRAFEGWAVDHRAKRVTMVHLEAINQRLGPLYERRGYKKLETHYYKELASPPSPAGPAGQDLSGPS